jgi:glycogen synthase
MDMDQKGIDLLLRAYSLVKDRINYPLVIAGNGPDENKIRALIEKLALQHRVKMVGPAYGEKKHALLAQSLFVAFSSRHETFSCFALEALASGSPLVAFDIPGLSWTNEKSTVKAEAYNVAAYAQALLNTAKNKNIHKMQDEARRYAARYTWENVANKFESFFQRVTVFQPTRTYAKT